MDLPINPFPEHKCSNIPETPKGTECIFCDFNRQIKAEGKLERLIPYDVPGFYPLVHDGKKVLVKYFSKDERYKTKS